MLDEYTVKITKLEPTRSRPRAAWLASVSFRQPGDFSVGETGATYEGETPQIALASLAAYWAGSAESGEAEE